MICTTLPHERKQVVVMPLGRGIEELWEAVRDRVEVSGHGPTWEVTAGSFDSALAFAQESFGDVAVTSRRDRKRWWPRVTLTVTTDPAEAASAPPLEELAALVVPAQVRPEESPDSRSRRKQYDMPLELEAIFAHQERVRSAQERVSEDAG